MLDFSKIQTYPIRERNNLVTLKMYADIEQPAPKFSNPELDRLAEKVIQAAKNGKHIILMMGAHIIKVGMAPYVIDMMNRGLIKHIAMNGAGPIHDFEIALIGETSEDVGHYIEDGSFGMIEETGSYINAAIQKGVKEGRGYGASVGKMIADENLPNKEKSILYHAHKLNIPVSVHVAIGTDIIHQHPSCDGAALGKASFDDFKLLAESVSKLKAGVVMNYGCAVVLPEAFLKALTICRNLKYDVSHFTAANIDMYDHYRPRRNVVERPTAQNGTGLIIIGRHEQTVPNLYQKLKGGLGWE